MDSRLTASLVQALLVRRVLNQDHVDALIAEEGFMRSLKRVRRRLHRCYELTFKAMIEEPGAEKFALVHGYYVYAGAPFGHAWIETGDGMIYDTVLDRYMPWDKYAAEYGAVVERRYTEGAGGANGG